ncbi:MAG: 3-hydroxyacyl-CoA dehydrogenase family protein [Lachnospiraceae bacterium]|nr:3-hydroxyacyl-CoA dehydrogenase family protein [Candidatus Equihabitans merdae]
MKLAIIGTGMIGASMAALFTGNGYDTTVLASKEASIEKGLKNWQDLYDVLKGRGLVTDEQIEACKALLHFTTDYADLADVDAIVEAVVENKELKWEVYKKLEENCPKCQVVMSVSSSMSPEMLIEGVEKFKDRILVTHPFYPPHLVPFVEMVKAPETSADAAKVAYDVLVDCGRKVCVMKKSAPGFIANRFQHALLREAFYMIEQGMADPEDIDKALKYSFMPRYSVVGLLEHQDAAGLDMVQSIENNVFPTLCNATAPLAYVTDKVKEGNLGQKTGQGIYSWTPESSAQYKVDAAEPYWQFFNWKLPE